MKNPLFTLLIVAALALQARASLQSECTLSAEIFPLEYVFVTRSVSFRMRLTSNCLRLRDFTFEGFFSFSRRLSKQVHPTSIDLVIFKNKYRLFFSGQAEKNQKTILRKYVYNQVNVSPSERASGAIRVDQDNRVVLDQQINNSYNIQSLKKLLYMHNPQVCVVKKDNRIMTCRIK
jgi:hypothetical protein